MATYYSVLGCEINASYEELKRKYQELAMQYHPDKQRDMSGSAAFSDVDKAWKVLRDPEQRKMYDATLVQKRLNEQPIVYDTVHLCELDWNESIYSYCYNCKCGGAYVLPKEHTNLDCFVTCDQCTLMVNVKV